MIGGVILVCVEHLQNNLALLPLEHLSFGRSS